jgi:phasin family protein
MAKRRAKRKRKVPTVKDDVQKITNENVDATMRPFEGATRATQAIAGEIADYTRRSFEHSAKTMEKLLGAKSPDKAFELQTEYAKAAYESYVGHATKLGQLYADLGQEAFKSYQDFAAKLTPVR